MSYELEVELAKEMDGLRDTIQRLEAENAQLREALEKVCDCSVTRPAHMGAIADARELLTTGENSDG